MELPVILKKEPLYFAILILFVLFLISIPLSFVLGSFAGPLTCILPFLLLVIIFILAFALLVKNVLRQAPSIGMSRKDQIAAMVSSFPKRKQEIGMKTGSYSLIPGEKELFHMTPAYVELGATYRVRDIIVTNFRIIGGYTTTYLVGATEDLSVNLWHSGLAGLPGYADKVGGDPVTGSGFIKEISLEKDEELGYYLKIKSSSMLLGHYSIYHPESEKIYRIFSAPIQKS